MGACLVDVTVSGLQVSLYLCIFASFVVSSTAVSSLTISFFVDALVVHEAYICCYCLLLFVIVC